MRPQLLVKRTLIKSRFTLPRLAKVTYIIFACEAPQGVIVRQPHYMSIGRELHGEHLLIHPRIRLSVAVSGWDEYPAGAVEGTARDVDDPSIVGIWLAEIKRQEISHDERDKINHRGGRSWTRID